MVSGERDGIAVAWLHVWYSMSALTRCTPPGNRSQCIKEALAMWLKIGGFFALKPPEADVGVAASDISCSAVRCAMYGVNPGPNLVQHLLRCIGCDQVGGDACAA